MIARKRPLSPGARRIVGANEAGRTCSPESSKLGYANCLRDTRSRGALFAERPTSSGSLFTLQPSFVRVYHHDIILTTFFCCIFHQNEYFFSSPVIGYSQMQWGNFYSVPMPTRYVLVYLWWLYSLPFYWLIFSLAKTCCTGLGYSSQSITPCHSLDTYKSHHTRSSNKPFIQT